MSNKSMRHTACAFSKHLGAYWDDQVPPGERAAIESHLHTCPACQEQLRVLRSLSATLASYTVPEAALSSDQEFWQRLSPRLFSRRIPTDSGIAAESLPIWPSLGLVISGATLKGLAVVASAVYMLYQWHLLPASAVTAISAVPELLVGPMIWETAHHLSENILSEVPAILRDPGRIWCFTFCGVAAVILLMLSTLYLAWLLWWVHRPDRIDGRAGAS